MEVDITKFKVYIAWMHGVLIVSIDDGITDVTCGYQNDNTS